MTKEEAITIADRFIATRLGPNPRDSNGPYSMQAKGARFNATRHRWMVVYQIIGPDILVHDGDIIVVVDPVTEEAMYFNDMWR